MVPGGGELGQCLPPARDIAHPGSQGCSVAEGPVRVGELAAVAESAACVAALLAALAAGDGLRRAGNGRTVADRAYSRRAEVPEAAAPGAGALERFARRSPVTGVAQVPVAELDRC